MFIKRFFYLLSLLILSNVQAQNAPQSSLLTRSNSGISSNGTTTVHEQITPLAATAAYSVFNLASDARTSAGVYDVNGNLLRTLWSGKNLTAGKHAIEWDGKDDNDNIIDPSGKIFKIIANNITATWDGVIGNTSDSLTGATVWHGLSPFNNLLIVGKYGYVSMGYSEGNRPQYKFLLSKPQQKLSLNNIAYTNVTGSLAATDGTNIYWTEQDVFASTKPNYVYASKASDDNYVTFSNGKSYTIKHSGTRSSVIDSCGSIATGFAVQKKGNYLFVAHGSSNELHVLNKITGALVKTITITNPSNLCVDGNDNLWMISNSTTVAKYTVNADGTLGTAALTLHSLVQPENIAMTNDYFKIVVLDGGSSQQVKWYNTNTGAPVNTLGTAGGYNNSPEVTTTKFYFSDVRGNQHCAISFQNDGSYWLLDGGNNRLLHFSSSNKYIEQVAYLAGNYVASANPKDNTQIFAGYFQYQVNYTSPIKSSWILKYNWGYNVPSNYDDKYIRLRNVVTLKNGRTYTLLWNNSTKKLCPVELTSAGLRFGDDNPMFQSSNMSLYPDGSVRNVSGNWGSNQTFTKYTLSGFDANGNPQWNNATTVLVTNAISKRQTYFGGARQQKWEQFSDGGIVLFFGNRQRLDSLAGKEFHLGLWYPGENFFRWQTARGTKPGYAGNFPTDGSFDNGNNTQYQGNIARIVGDKYILWGYNGEFWKNSETNKFNLVDKSGLFLTQFGVTGVETVGEAPYGMAGNSFSWDVTKNGDNFYLWTCDESQHGGIHRWTISGLNTINTYTATAVPYTASIDKSIDLMADVPDTDTAAFYSTGHWTRYPNTQSTAPNNIWQVTANTKSFGTSKDLYTQFQGASSDHYLRYDFGAVTSSDYTLSGKVSLSPQGNSKDGGQYIEMLDANNKVISRFYITADYTNHLVKVNNGNSEITSVNSNAQNLLKFEHPLSIEVNSSGTTIHYYKYPSVTAPLVDNTADWRHPKYFRLSFWTTGKPLNYNVDLQDFKLTY